MLTPPDTTPATVSPAGTVRLTTAQALVRFLSCQYTERDGHRQRLITACWGIFGHGNVAGLGQALVEAAAQDPASLPFLQGRNEQSMVHAAVGFARQSGRLSTHAVTTSIGPGATNLVTGAALATINRIPVLLLPGDVFAGRPADPVLQQLETPWAGDVSVNDTLRPVSRFFDRIWRPEMLIPAALQAMRVLTDPVDTGAVTLALPQDVQAQAHDWPAEFFTDRVWRIRRPQPDLGELERAVRLVRAAERPLIVAGGGVHHSAAEDALRALADATGIPVAETQAGRGALEWDHPCALGGLGHTGTAAANAVARRADVVIGVGTRWSDFTTASATLFAEPGVRFVNVNVAASDGHKLAGQPLVADARVALEALTARLGTYRVPESHRAQYADGVARWQRAVDEAVAAPDGSRRPTQAQLLGILGELLEPTDVVVNAAGSMPGDLHRLWRPRERRQYHVEYGYSCMGYEIPAALGVRLAAPEREVFALVGDGTYLMMPTELVTAVQEGIKIVPVLVQNHGYASIGALSESVGAERYGTDYRFRTADGRYAGHPLPVDLAANMESLGVDVLCPRTVAELRQAVLDARKAERPTAIYVETVPPEPDLPALESHAWWEVAVAEVSASPAAREARERYESARCAQRRYL
ncbi:3D-(3,5/4)-trihydroxycyclohexane-1,2-dione acylhydrolase (decyclizing) [Streptomyces sp. NBC_00354]|uniref:3D-(3,5/4)-trihydroxycyclohexane-1,2-dione acylhydrolase (decyclizing) n=1 Tax=Streptomyces sp. NBC_00354 TaxID=2975723 RepID=UPI002E26ED81|nr:3D-(3,5/4)-trihydroxycyclohexane-1,2-dione acylhydrolase (decyclizing) [Streptomyces sp. NBC_01001]